MALVGCSQKEGKDAATATDTATAADSVKAQKRSISLAFVGDMMLGTDFPEDAGGRYLPADSGRHVLDGPREILQRVDIAAGNLEGALGHGGTAKHCNDPKLCFTFRMPGYMADRLAEAGFDYMNMANNHMLDFGEGGIDAGKRELDRVGIAYGGVKAGPVYSIVERGGVKVGFTGFSTTDACHTIHDYDAMVKIVKEMREKCDIVVVCIHAGAEGAAYTHVPRKPEIFHGWPRGDVYKFAHTAIDNGADIVWGHGPHVTRGMELYRDRLIMYSLGNFATPVRMGIAGATGHAPLVEVTVSPDGKFEKGQIHPFIQQKGVGLVGRRSMKKIDQMRRLSREDVPESKLRIEENGSVNY